ncbi:MAG: parallel beta-helix domain-containing protein [Caulobacterales bacterium]|uniref:parallel beta-helix domain-containing protein n=1 Tax=Glycocaulis sp. TaxID=1969725 RepID=UPI003FA131CE
MIRIWKGGLAGLTMALVLQACGQPAGETRDTSQADREYQNVLMEALLDAEPGSVIEIPAGVFVIERGLSLANVDGVTLRGAGMDETVLSFAEQRAGAEGLLVTSADNFTIEDLAIEDSIGDALKITGSENVIIRRVRTEWTRGASTDNGAYGIYPVLTTNVLIEDSVAIGASDAGIYVGQSDNIVVRNNRAEYNVAGIEIENSMNADVYGNTATNNTGGILVFNMPNLPRPGHGTRVFDNDVFANNTRNFGHAGTPVANVPAGTGILVNSNDDVEIFNNRVADNRTANVIISSLHSAGFSELGVESDFDPYPEGIHIYSNTFEGGGNNPDGMELQALRIALFGPTGRIPDVLWDGYVDEAKLVDGALPDDLRLCVSGAEVLNADGPGGYGNPRLVTAEHDCSHAPRSAVELPF